MRPNRFFAPYMRVRACTCMRVCVCVYTRAGECVWCVRPCPSVRIFRVNSCSAYETLL